MIRRGLCVLAALLSACGDSVVVPPNITFDGARAMEYIKVQLDAGPRVPGTPAHKNTGDWLVKNLKLYADSVIEQTFTHVTLKKDTLHLRNIFVQFNPKATKRILYVTHWDCKPLADKSFAADDKSKPVPGANDGASGTALLMVLAEALKKMPPTIGVDFLFTDGEDYGDFDGADVDVLLGAKYFAEHMLPDASYKPIYGILWDMIGDKDLKITKEANSAIVAPGVIDSVWAMADGLGYARVFVPEVLDVKDDHVPLNKAGLRVIDVIDINYDSHHTTQDTFDKVSAQSLEIVGRVALAMIRAHETPKP